MKARLQVAKRISKSGNAYLGASLQIGKFSKPDFYLPSITNVMALTGLSMDEIEKADIGVLYDKEIEV